jgi:diguanylate cyclase (GGDEF)-like protein
MEEKCRREANYDSLTSLPNRNLFRDRLELEVKRVERSGTQLALLFIDLDGFKEVNDGLGHAAGDQLLISAAQRIHACVRSTDTVARLGGDEFTVILTEVNRISSVELLAQEIMAELARPFLIGQKEVKISGSIGITLCPHDGMSAEDLLRNADQAMYVSKNAGRNRFSFFTVSMRDSAWARLKVIEQLRHALPLHQLIVVYQPVIDLASGDIVKAEALLRWQHPEFGLMQPLEFINLAEEIGTIAEIDTWVFNESLNCAKKWSAISGFDFQISVNKSAFEFSKKIISTDWSAQLSNLKQASKFIAVEITEKIFMHDTQVAIDRLNDLQNSGIQLIIDHFGIGHSLMAYLRKFEVDYLKMDQSFIQDSPTNENSRTMCETMVIMAHKLGLKAIAPGVENIEQRDWLKAMGCDMAQGYFFSRPVSEEAFTTLLIKQKEAKQLAKL